MELRHMRYFVAVAEELSFGRAASRLSIAQPPLSRQIRALEDEVGARLLVRTKRRVLLTEAGRAFLDGARTALAQATRAVDQARRAARGENGSLSLAFAPSAEIAIMGPIVHALSRAHRDVRLEVHTCADHEALRAVRAGTIEVAVLTTPRASEPDLRTEPLTSRRLQLAVPATHPLAKRRRVSLRQVANEPVVLFARAVAPALHDAVVATFQNGGVTLNVRHETSHLHACLGLVAAGLGVSVLPSSASKSVLFRTIEPAAASLDFVAAYRQDLAAQAVQTFLRTARAALRTA
jgi:DNA-binding transcriptional LysR family regulator